MPPLLPNKKAADRYVTVYGNVKMPDGTEHAIIMADRTKSPIEDCAILQSPMGLIFNTGDTMKKELPHFAIGSAYGGSQDWCTELWMKIGGCAAVTACDSSIFFMLHKGRRELYPYALNDISRRDYVDFTDIMRPYLHPREGGVDRLDIYIDGFGKFLRDRDESTIQMTPWPGERDLTTTEAVVKKQIENGWLIPCLTLHHRHPSMSDYVWHWYLLNGYAEQDGTLLVKAVTFGSWRWLDFSVLWNTGYDRKGGLILYSAS